MSQQNNKNYAFIDSQNLNLGVKALGWNLDFKKFRIYLKEKYSIAKAYIFIGYMEGNQNLYRSLQEYGYVLIFKPVIIEDGRKPKGNIDADLVLQAMIDFYENHFEKAVIVTSDGDFYSLVDYFYRKNKLLAALSPNKEKCSILLQKSAREKMMYLNNLKQKLEYKRKNTA
ncbi:MAG: NYN domain-containing protein [bacterium]|nr:NYN domain-containing protein [bacterium]